jgi:hypothetical protein
MNKNRLHIFLLMLSSASFAQNIEIRGKVVDGATKKPLPFASLQIEKTYIGTTTNAEGNFRLIVPYTYAETKLLVSFIGYTLQKVSIHHSVSNPFTIELVPESRQLRELVIMPDSSLLVFLREAYTSIEKNYTDKPYELEGFYRESLKSASGRYIYFGEAQLLIQGSGYQFANEEGNVKVLKYRTNHFTETDTIFSALYYGGPFIGVWNDRVKKKSDILRPDKRNYHYQLLDVTMNNGKEVWIIGVDKNDGTVKAKLFIEKDSKAYLRTEVERFSKDSLTIFFAGASHAIKRMSRTFYKQINDKWFLQYTDHQKVEFNKKLQSRTAVTTEFSTTKTTIDSVQLLPFDDRMNYSDVFSQLQDNTSEDFWKDNITIVQDSSLQAQLVPYHSAEKIEELMRRDTSSISRNKLKKVDQLERMRRAQKRIRFLTRIGFGIGTQFLPYLVSSGNFALSYSSANGPLNFNKSIENLGVPLLLTNEISFKLSNRWQLVTTQATDLSKQYNFDGRMVGIRYSMLLNLRGRPLMLLPSLGYNNHLFAISFPEFNNEGGLQFDNKEMGARKLRFWAGEKVHSGWFALSLDKKLSGLKWLSFTVGYYAEIERKNTVFLREESGFSLFRKLYSVPLEFSGVTFTQNNNPVPTDLQWFNNIHVSLSVRWSF